MYWHTVPEEQFFIVAWSLELRGARPLQPSQQPSIVASPGVPIVIMTQDFVTRVRALCGSLDDRTRFVVELERGPYVRPAL